MEVMLNWQSVIIQGKFEALRNNDQKMSFHKLVARLQLLCTSETRLPKKDASGFLHGKAAAYNAVVFRMKVISRMGKFEKQPC